MALGASHRNTKQRRRKHLDRISHYLLCSLRGGSAGDPAQKARCRQYLLLGHRQIVPGFGNQIVARQLFHDKSVQGHIRIQGTNHPIPKAPSMVPRRIGGAVPLGVGVTDNIKPMAAPAFAIGGRREQFINRQGPPIGIFVGLKKLNLLKSWGNPSQIKRGPNEKIARRGGRIKPQTLLFELCLD